MALAALSAAAPRGVLAQGGASAADLVDRAAMNQGSSLFMRDRSRYEQRLLMERFKYDPKTGATGDLIARRQTTVVVEPDTKPDETGRIPVVTRVVADTDDKGQPKDKVDPNARTGLASGAFLDEVFFPLVPENIQYMKFEEVDAKAPGERWFRFGPKAGAQLPPDRPIASGLVQLDATTGEVLTLEVTALANLQALDKHLDKISSFKAKIDYSQFAGKYRLPTAANGSGVSDVSHFAGYFKFVFEEGKYAPVMKAE